MTITFLLSKTVQSLTPSPRKGTPTIFIFFILKFSNAIHHKEYYGTEKEKFVKMQ